ncbi:MAG: hypothetical protein P4L66_10375 [Acetobacteraceae bacterium]|nr:hypothetical protein [Acetobacteraceae bacterium]
MTTPRSAFKALPLATLLLGLAGCGQFHAQNSLEGVSQARQDECRSRTEESFVMHNRGDIYRADTAVTGTSASPFSGASPSTASSDALGTRYAYQRALNDCYNASPDPVPGASSKP